MSDEYDEFKLNDTNWRDHVEDDVIHLCGNVEATEYEVMLIIEKLTPILREKEDRYPNERDIADMVLMLRGE